MRRLALAVLLLASPIPCQAQAPSSAEILDRLQGGGVLLNFVMLDQPAVQREIQATPEQVEAARKLAQEQKMQLQGLAQLPREEAAARLMKARTVSESGLKQILSSQQYARLRQIGLQQAGPLIGLTNPEIAAAVGLSTEQRSQLQELQESVVRQFSGMAQSQSGLGRGRALLETIREAQAAKQQADSRALAMLTVDQQMKWSQVQGPKFEGETQFGGLRGRLRQR